MLQHYLFTSFRYNPENIMRMDAHELVNTFSVELYCKIFTHLKLCLATVTHNLKWVKITHIGINGEQTFANIDV